MPSHPPPVSFPPVPGDIRTNPEAVFRWITQNVPCFVGEVPGEWTDAVIVSLGRSLVPTSVIAQAMLTARRNGYQFAPTTLSFQSDMSLPRDVFHPPLIRGKHSGKDHRLGPRTISLKEAAKINARILNEKYELASKTNNSRDMERIAREFVETINNANMTDLEIQHGAPLLRRAIRIRVPVGSESGQGGVGWGRSGPWELNIFPGSVLPPPRRGR